MITVSPICTDVSILNLINIAKKAVTLIGVAGLVALIIFIGLDIIKTVSSADADNKKLFKSVSKRLMAAVIIFLVPTIIHFVLSIIPMETLYYVDCYNTATDDNILYIADNNALEAMNKLNTAILNEDYESANTAYQEAQSKIRKIPNKRIRDERTDALEATKDAVLALKDGEDISDIVNTEEGDYQLDASASKYEYSYLKNNLKKYKNLSEERKNIVLTAAKYAGKIPYYWGGRANSKVFEENNFGSKVSADYKGRTKKGLDCSHFVDFIFWQVMNDNLGNSNTTYIWKNRSTAINESELLPGDVGFLNDPSVGSNHIGIYAGTDDDGEKIWIHLTGLPQNTVVINNIKLPCYRRIDLLK